MTLKEIAEKAKSDSINLITAQYDFKMAGIGLMAQAAQDEYYDSHPDAGYCEGVMVYDHVVLTETYKAESEFTKLCKVLLYQYDELIAALELNS